MSLLSLKLFGHCADDGEEAIASDFTDAYFGESDRSFRFYPITFSSSFSSLPVLP